MCLRFIDILQCQEDLQQEIRIWRNGVKNFMYGEHEISENEHKKWLKNLEFDEKNFIFIAFFKNEPVGVVSLNDFDKKQKTSSWGFYLNPNKSLKIGIGAILEYEFLEFCFSEFELIKLNCEVLATNEKVAKMHIKFGFKLEGIRRENVIKSGKRLDVLLLGMLKNEWQTHKISMKIKNKTNQQAENKDEIKQETRNKEQGTRNKEQGTRNKEQGTRNKEQGTRNSDLNFFLEKNITFINPLQLSQTQTITQKVA